MKLRQTWRPGGAWGVVALALALNLLFIASDLPDVTHPDEPRVVLHAVAMGTGDLNPHFFFYPTLWIYIVFAGQAIASACGLLLGFIRDREELEALVFTDPSLFFLAGRILAALAGAAAVAVAWRIGRRFSRLCAWTSGLTLTLFGPFTWQAHYATVDAPLVLAVLLCLDACSARVAAETAARRGAWWPPVAAGLAASIKYTGVVALGAVVTMRILEARRRADPDRRSLDGRAAGARPMALLLGILGAASLAALAFLATSPFVLLDWRAFLRDARVVVADLGMAGGVEPGPLGYARFAIREQALPLVLLGLAGWGIFIRGWVRGRSARTPAGVVQRDLAFVLAGFFIPYLLLIEFYTYRNARTFLPLVPAIGIGAGVGLERLAGLIRRLVRSPDLARGVAPVLLALALLPSVQGTIAAEHDLATPSADSQVARWFRETVPAGTKVIVDSGTRVHLPPDSITVASRIELWRLDTSPNARHLLRAYTHYLATGRPDRGYRLVPTARTALNTFQSGQDPERDYDPSRLNGVAYVIAAGGALAPTGGTAKEVFFREVLREFRPVHEARGRDGTSIVVLARR